MSEPTPPFSEPVTDRLPTQPTVHPEPEQPAPPNVELTEPPISSTNNKPIVPEDISESYVSLLNVDMKELDLLSQHYPKMDSTTNQTTRAWYVAYRAGLETLLKGSSFSKSVQRETGQWRQRVDAFGEKLGASRPRFGKSNNNIISGDRALMKATNVLGLGSIVQVPLWHTGIWVTIKAPTEASLLELERRIANEKISLGRYTSGMVFSNTSIYTVSYVVNFVLNHVYDASVKNITQEALKNLIKVTDIPTLVWAIACAIYPNGYNYVRPCTTNPSECQHLVKGTLSVGKLFWTDNAALSEYQRRHMTRRGDKFTEEELERYENEHTRGGPYLFNIHEHISVKLRVPTIAQYEQSGFGWVDGIVQLLEGSLGVSLKGKERDNYIIDQGRLTALRQYSHWVEQIDVEEDSVVDAETIEALLANLSSQEELSNLFFEKVGQYIDESVISLIAIPKYDCPACGGEQTGDVHINRHPHLLPIDVVSVFFLLLDQHIYKALTSRRL